MDLGPAALPKAGVTIPTRQGISGNIEASWPVLNPEIIANEFTDPVMLRNSGQALIEKKLERIMIRAHHKAPPPQVWPPVTYSLCQTNQLTFICRHLQVPGRKQPAKECNGARSLMQNSPKS